MGIGQFEKLGYLFGVLSNFINANHLLSALPFFENSKRTSSVQFLAEAQSIVFNNFLKLNRNSKQA